jgi:hypothetical protein
MNYKIIIGTALILCNSFLFAQKNTKCNGSVFLNIEFKGNKLIFDKPNGKVIGNLKHKFKDEDYIVFTISNKNDSMFYVSAYYDIGGFIVKGWIKKDKNIGIYSKAYDQPLKLYRYPDKDSKVNCIINEYNPAMYIVIDCIGEWLKVKTLLHGEEYIGWMSPDMQCCNVYSTCS